jgi:hypothetical protein
MEEGGGCGDEIRYENQIGSRAPVGPMGVHQAHTDGRRDVTRVALRACVLQLPQHAQATGSGWHCADCTSWAQGLDQAHTHPAVTCTRAGARVCGRRDTRQPRAVSCTRCHCTWARHCTLASGHPRAAAGAAVRHHARWRTQ